MRDAVELAIRARGVLTIEDEARATLFIYRVEQRSERVIEPSGVRSADIRAVWDYRFRFVFENQAWRLVGGGKKLESLPPNV